MQGCPFAQQFVEKMLMTVMSPPNFPVPYSEIRARIIFTPECPERIDIGSLTIRPIPLSHPNQGNGYKFMEDGRTFVFLTDNELDFRHEGGRPFQEYVAFCAGADLLVHDAEYTEEEYRHAAGWGHSLYTTALSLAIQAGVKCFGLFHHNQWRDDDQIDRMVAHCRKIIREAGAEMECFAVAADMIRILES